MNKDRPKNILVIRLSSIGDIILSIPLILELKNKYPNSEIDYLVAKKYREVLAPLQPYLKQIHCFNKNSKEGQEIKRIRNEIRKSNYNWILDIHNSLRTKRLLLPIHNKIYKIKKYEIRRFLFVKLGWNIYPEIPVYRKYLNTPPIELSQNCSWYLENYAQHTIQDQLIQDLPFLKDNSPVLVIFPGAKHKTKRWPLKKYFQLIQKLRENTNWNIIISGDKKDKKLLQNIEWSSNQITNICGQYNIKETMNLVAMSNAIISNDSGPMHIGAFLHKPQIAIFGNTVKEFGFYPLNDKAKIIENNSIKCRPCSHIGYNKCPQSHFKCMEEISVDEVFDQTIKLIDKTTQ